MQITIWDLDYYYGNSKTVNVDCMKVSSYHHQKGDVVTLGSNGQSSYCVNYFVLAASEKETVTGDVNTDGVFNAGDAVMLQKWLLGISDTEPGSWQAGDLNSDGIINICDLCLIKNMLLK